MTYDPYRQPEQYQPYAAGPPPQQRADYEYAERLRSERRANNIAHLVQGVTGLIVAIFAAHVLFVVLDANQANGFVATVYMLAKTLVLGLGDVFTPDDAVVGVVMNYGLAALIYLVVSQLICKALRRD
ncbi:hypothetical protein FHU38_004152 [Saccharomonospora amisosensis]|uniref:Uncharacterized protein n=1 Tax=Saccharomonospora amisosensis TaxID=1128677 RepID=A0A7X5ZSD5_9PSEU|nr:hypothetical protein [Saccharomonospora amisosensis]NIJ13808.1 hypothetical protein [Saccharomonospora amisosensis]